MPCTCRHSRMQHRRGVGRCLVAACSCLFAPAKPQPARRVQPPLLRTTTVDDSGLVQQTQRERSQRERLEEMLWNRIQDALLPLPVRQFHWAKPERKYRSDFAYPQDRILIEVQGGIWAKNPGRHNRGSGYQSDSARDNLAALKGWKLLRFTEAMIKSRASDGAVETIRRALQPAETML
jgi:very-short-patch-repair endonuclease